MQIAIMQPYVFPYIGYFQLIEAADILVLYNDVNWINRGWINRNKILINNQPSVFTIPCKKTSQNKLINEIEINIDISTKKKLLNSIQLAYKRAPYFNQIFPYIQELFTEEIKENETIDTVAYKSIRLVLNYLNIQKTIKYSSKSYPQTKSLPKADRLIAICQQENCDTYINAAGGKDLYDKEYFQNQGIDLFFIKSNPVEYRQFDNNFVPNLSIIDVLMFNSKDKMLELFEAYELV